MRRPRFIAEQARDARGPLGWLIAFIMARETWLQNERAIAALQVQDGDHVLDVGCGHGRSLGTLALLTPTGRVVGADPSELMAKIAVSRNKALIQKGRIGVAIAPVEELPFAAAAFDRALCVHVLYFWPDLGRALGELARVLRPGGRLVLLFRPDEAAATSTFPPEVYRFRSREDVRAALLLAGFEREDLTDASDCVLLTARRAQASDRWSQVTRSSG